MLTKFKFIDLFCGIGGFHQAMASLGGRCVFACDIDPYCQDTYFENYGIMPIGDITKVDAAIIPPHDVLCGGFPCQAFSIAGKRLGFADPTKGTLFFDIMRIVNFHHPKYILLENVRNLASHDNGNTWRVIHQSLVDAGYNVSPTPVIFSPHFIGIPQHRDRVFIMAVRADIGQLPDFYFDRSTVKPCSIYPLLQADCEIPHIERYRLSRREVEILEMWNIFIKGLKERGIKLPLFPVTDLFMKDSTDCFDYDKLEPQKAMTARRNVELYNKCPDFIDDWLEKAYHNPKFKGARRMLEWHAGDVAEPDIWDTVIQFRQSGIRCRRPHHFPTLTAVVQVPVVAKFKRKITPRECARLQSFPDTFKCDPRQTQAYKQFGNSVNVDVVKLFARFLLGDPEVQRKYTRPNTELPTYADGEMAGKRKRGRPRKYADGTEAPRQRRPRLSRSIVLYDLDGQPAKRKRGRPRKYLAPGEMPVLLFTSPEEALAAAAEIAAGADPMAIAARLDAQMMALAAGSNDDAPYDGAELHAADGAPAAPAQPRPAPQPLLGPDGQPIKRKRGRPRKYPI